MNVLKEKGIFAFICSNKFAKAKYGEKLRKLILENQLKIYYDFTGVKVFKEASVDTCVIQIKKDFKNDNEIYVDNNYYLKQKLLNKNSFTFKSPEVLNLRDKILSLGIPLKDLDVKINRGVLTGFNKAFIIDEETKNRLIKEDSNNKEIIKPILRGRDINKWKILYQNLYLIHSVDGLNTKEEYPYIYEFLQQYQEKLEKRYDKGKNWFNLRSCSYDYLFEKEKIIYSEISPEPSFTFDSENYYLGNTAYLINSDTINLKYLLALLNSNVLFWIFKQICYNLGKSGFRFIKNFVEQLPIVLSQKYEKEILVLVDTILDLTKELNKKENEMYAIFKNELNIIKLTKKLEKFYLLSNTELLKELKKKNKNFDEKNLIKIFEKNKNDINSLNCTLEQKIFELNKIVYEIYNLNEEEIIIIENDI